MAEHSTPAPSPAKQYIAYLDGLRALAALLVVFHHIFFIVQPSSLPTTPGLGKSVQFLFLLFGHDAVDIFIVLSGFCLMLPVVRGDGFLAG